MKQPVALFTLNDTSQAVEFARSLTSLGWTVLATMETVPLLKAAGIPCEDIYTFTGIKEDYGFPPTLHPKMEHALTVEDSPWRIDLVYVLPYLLEKGNDVGGRTLLALAGKGSRIPVMSHDDMRRVITDLQDGGSISQALKTELIAKSSAAIASHYLDLVKRTGSEEYAGFTGCRAYRLMNGENPYQTADLFDLHSEDPLAIPRFENLSETVICQVNLSDIDNLLVTLCLLADGFKARYGNAPYITVASKHGNVCGSGFSWDSKLASIEKALFGNPLAVWGGELMVNFPVDDVLAEVLIKHPHRTELVGSAAWMLDVVAAPAFSPGALQHLRQRAFRKILLNPALAQPEPELSGYSYRMVRGGFIRQSPPWRGLLVEDFDPDSRDITDGQFGDLLTAWAAVYSSFHGGNEVALAKDGMLLGVGGGPSTVQAGHVAVERACQAGHDLAGSTFCADAFFPFTDAPEILVKAGAGLGMVPSGGKNETQVMEFFASHNVKVVTLPEEFRGFCRH
ncbi:MAG: hypothetical protein AAGU25_03320 [bacterium]